MTATEGVFIFLALAIGGPLLFYFMKTLFASDDEDDELL